LEPKVDDTIRPKFDSARSLLASLKDPTSTDDPIKLLRALDSAIREIESYLMSLQSQPTANTQAAEQRAPQPAETAKESPRESSQLSDARPQTEALRAETKDAKIQDKVDKQDRQKSKDANKKQPFEVSRIEAKLAELEPHIDENIKPKFESAKSMLAKLKETGAEPKKTIRAINALIDEITKYVESSDSEDDDRS
jgi:DNA-binding transcriptional MerR regulator